MDWTAIIVAFVAGGLLTKIFEALINAGKPKAELADLFATTAKQLVEASNSRSDDLQEQINELKAEISQKDIEAGNMSNEIEALRNANQVKDKKIMKLETDYELLKAQYSDLKRRYEVLEEQYQELVRGDC